MSDHPDFIELRSVNFSGDFPYASIATARACLASHSPDALSHLQQDNPHAPALQCRQVLPVHVPLGIAPVVYLARGKERTSEEGPPDLELQSATPTGRSVWSALEIRIPRPT